MNTKILIIPVLFAVLLSSCDTHRFYLITDEEKQVIPYELGQTVNFINSSGHSVRFTVTTDTLYSWTMRDGGGRIISSEYWTVDRREVILQPESDNFKIELSIEAYDELHGWSNFRMLTTDPLCVYYGIYKNAKFKDEYDFDSLEINNKIYYDIYKFNNSYNIPAHILYNKTHGILQITMNDENYLTLQE